MKDDEISSTGQEPSLSSSSRSGRTGLEPSLGGEQNLTWFKIQSALDSLEVSDMSRGLATQAMRDESRDPRAVPALVEMLRRESGHLKMRIARVLGEIGDTTALPGLVEALNDEHDYVQSAAAWALGKIRHGYAVPYLGQMLERDPDSTALWALKQIGDTHAADVIESALSHPHPFIRRGAAIALGEMKYLPAIAALEALMHDHFEEVRMAAAEALQRIEAYQALNELKEQGEQPDAAS